MFDTNRVYTIMNQSLKFLLWITANLFNGNFWILDEELEDSLQATPRRFRRTSRVAKAEDTSKDVTNCFGFDEDEDD